MSIEDVEKAIVLLKNRGFVVDSEFKGAVFSVADVCDDFINAIESNGYSGSLVCAADPDGGEWTYFIYDTEKLEPRNATRRALRQAQKLRNG